MITTINEFKNSLNESKITKNMTFVIQGVTYTVTGLDGNLIKAKDSKGNTKMFNSKYLLETGTEFIKPKRIMAPRKPKYSQKEYEDLLRSAVSNPDMDNDEDYEGYSYSELHDIAQSLIHDEKLETYLAKLYKDNEGYEHIRQSQLVDLLTDELSYYA